MWKRDAMPKSPNSPTDPQPSTNAAPPPAPVFKPVEARSAETLVMDLGKSVRIKGELSASEDMTLCGQMEGRVTLPEHSLTIGPEADIRAEIKASTVIIMGVVLGTVTATKKIDLRATGSVTGDIAAPRIVIADGGQILGKVQITGEKAQARRTA